MRHLWLGGLVLGCLTGIGGAGFAHETGHPLTALARLTEAPPRLEDTRRGAQVELSLTQPVPWRVFTLDDPPRLVLDFSELDFSGGADGAGLAAGSARVTAVSHGLWRPGWTRMVLELAEPLKVTQAGMRTAGGAGAAALSITLERSSAEDFAAGAGAPPSAVFAEEAGRDLPAARTRQTGDGPPLVVVLDPPAMAALIRGGPRPTGGWSRQIWC